MMGKVTMSDRGPPSLQPCPTPRLIGLVGVIPEAVRIEAATLACVAQSILVWARRAPTRRSASKTTLWMMLGKNELKSDMNSARLSLRCIASVVRARCPSVIRVHELEVPLS